MLGAAGGALGPMSSGAVTFVLSFLLARVVFGYLAPFGAFARIAGSALAMGVTIWLLPTAPNVFILGAYVLLGGAIYATLLSVAMPAERRILFDMIHRKLLDKKGNKT